MVNEEKVRIMTQIALDETKNYKKEINEGGYYRSDYVRSHIISVLWNVTVSYLLVLFLIAFYHADYIFVNVVRLDYKSLGIEIIGIYFVLVVATLFFSYFYFSEKYAKDRVAIREYLDDLQKLEDFYAKLKEGNEDDSATSV